METRSSDDWSAFSEAENMFLGLAEPYRMIREETESGLRRQVADTVLKRIQTIGTPKFLTLGRKIDDGTKMIVTHYGFCVQTKLHVNYRGGTKHEVMDATITFLFGNLDKPGTLRSRPYFDLHNGAAAAFDDQVFENRLKAFRAENTSLEQNDSPASSGIRKPWWKRIISGA